jgi:vacuolar-type H+-ATPase subunit E/Vma4
MSVEEIVRVVESDAQAEAEAIVAAARDSAATVVAAAEAAAEARVREACERAEPGHRAEAMRLVNTARLRLLEQRAARSAALVDAVSEAAATCLATIAAEPDGARWAGALARLMEETAGLVGPGGILAVRPVDADAARPTAARLGCCLEVMASAADPGQDALGKAFAAGVLGRSADGRVEVDATLPARLQRARVRLAEPVARLLGVDA